MVFSLLSKVPLCSATVTGELTGTPGDGDVGRHLLVVTVTDGTAPVSKAFTIDVSNVNDAPEWRLPPDDLELEHGTPLLMAVQAVDADGDDVQYYIASEPAAEGLTVGVLSGDVAWYKPRPGTYLVTVTASDGEEDVDTVFDLVIKRAKVEDEGMGNAPLYAAIAALLVVVVLLLLWTVMGGAVAAEMLEWFKREYGFEEKQKATDKGGEDWDHLMDLARTSPPGSRGTMFLPHMSGASCPVVDSASMGAFVGLRGFVKPNVFRQAGGV